MMFRRAVPDYIVRVLTSRIEEADDADLAEIEREIEVLKAMPDGVVDQCSMEGMPELFAKQFADAQLASNGVSLG
jgi:hypothetical protein